MPVSAYTPTPVPGGSETGSTSESSETALGTATAQPSRGSGTRTLRNYAMVARRFDVSRRRDTLTFQHHAEVCALADDDQDFWLDIAAEHHWSKADLRRRVRAARRNGQQAHRSTRTPPRLPFAQRPRAPLGAGRADERHAARPLDDGEARRGCGRRPGHEHIAHVLTIRLPRHHRLKEGKLDAERSRVAKLVDFTEGHEPQLIAFNE